MPALSTPALTDCAVMTSRMPAVRYVPEIIFRRPAVSDSLPMVSGPARFPAATARKQYGVSSGLTWKSNCSTRP